MQRLSLGLACWLDCARHHPEGRWLYSHEEWRGGVSLASLPYRHTPTTLSQMASKVSSSYFLPSAKHWSLLWHKWELQWHNHVSKNSYWNFKIQLIFKYLRVTIPCLPTYSYEEWVMRMTRDICHLIEGKTFPLVCSGRDPVITGSVPANHLITLSVRSGGDGGDQLNWNYKQKQTLNSTELF